MNNPIFKVLVCALLCGTSVQADLKDSDKVTESDYGCFRISLLLYNKKYEAKIKSNIKADFKEECKKKNGEIITWSDLKANIPNQILEETQKGKEIEAIANKERRTLKVTEVDNINYHVYKIGILKLMAEKAPDGGESSRIYG